MTLVNGHNKKNSFNPILLLVWLIFNSVRSTHQVETKNVLRMVVTGGLHYLYCPQNHLSRVQNTFLYVCTVMCAIQFCVAVHPFKQKRTVCNLPYRKKNPLSKFTIVIWHHSSSWYSVIKREKMNLNFKVFHMLPPSMLTFI